MELDKEGRCIMNYLKGFYLMPHPPIIVPEVGRGEEKKIQMTADSCLKIAQEIKTISPETIIVVTPHGIMFSDAISISYDLKISGSLAPFRASKVCITKEIDHILSDEIINASKNASLPIVSINAPFLRQYQRRFELDHGTIVPLSFIEKEYENYKIVHITYGLLKGSDLFRFGTIIKDSVEKLKRKAVIIASGDLSHRLTKDGPYPYSPKGKLFDETLLKALEKGETASVFSFDGSFVEEAGQCGLKAIQILLGALNGEFRGELLSYEGPFGVGYGVMKFIPQKAKKDILKEIISLESKKRKRQNPYVKLARESIKHYFLHNLPLKLPSNIPEELIKNKAGVFVSLKKYGNLRGCIGTFLPTTDNIGEEIIRNAMEAAFNDPRFSPLQKSELDEIEFSVDVLSLPSKAKKEDLDPKKYGVIVTQGWRRGLLLPNLEGIDTIDLQLRIACEKAGISPNSTYQIEKFTVTRYQEEL